MYRSLLFIAALAFASAAPNLGGRIAGGNQTMIEQIPYIVSLQAFGNLPNCGGSIIGPNTIITAAHCLEEVDELLSLTYLVVYGTTDTSVRTQNATVKETIVHEQYNGLDYDVALIILNKNLTWSDQVQSVPLTDVEPEDGDVVRVAGWGLLHEWDLHQPSLLYSVDVHIVNRTLCKEENANVGEVSDRMICAGETDGGKDSCSGDSGGPLTRDGILVGIVSWGNGCAEPGYPGVYTNVASVKAALRKNATQPQRKAQRF